MKIYKKTYGVRNLVEWQANIPVGKGRLVVHFAGGSITAYGVTPAVYRTEDPIHQSIIENSDYFRSGRIFLQKVEFVKEVADPAPTVAPAAPAPIVEAPKVETPAPAVASATIEEAPGKVEEPASDAAPDTPDAGEPAQESPEEPQAPTTPTATSTAESEEKSGDNVPKVVGTDENGFAILEVACTEDARQYLMTTFGYTASALRTKAYIRDKAAANKIKFTINGAEL